MKNKILLILAVAFLAFVMLSVSSCIRQSDYGKSSAPSHSEAEGPSSKKSLSADELDGFDAVMGAYIDENGKPYTTVDIINNSFTNYTRILLTLSFDDAGGKSVMSYDAGTYVNFDRDETYTLYLDSFDEQVKNGKLSKQPVSVRVVSGEAEY